MPSYREYYSIAERAAKKAGEIIAQGFNADKDIVFKGFADPVTEFDRQSEHAVVDTILQSFPSHSILTEELLSRQGTPDFLWIIDPLDGTVNFTHRIPFVAVSIALVIEGETVIGIVYNPILEEFYSAVKGEGAFCNGKSQCVSKIDDIGKSLIATGFPYEREGRIEELMKPMPVFLRDYQAYRRLGSATMDLVYLAAGKFEGFYEENLKAWDTAAGALIAREAGALITDYYNNPYHYTQKTILATNGLIHAPMLSMLGDITPPK